MAQRLGPDYKPHYSKKKKKKKRTKVKEEVVSAANKSSKLQSLNLVIWEQMTFLCLQALWVEEESQTAVGLGRRGGEEVKNGWFRSPTEELSTGGGRAESSVAGKPRYQPGLESV
jgi:hypothetical protein